MLDRPDLARFHAAGLWDASWTPFAYFDGARCVAGLCLLDLPLVVGGQPLRAGGLAWVATHPAYRRRGLFRRLLDAALAHACSRSTTMMLFTANPSLYADAGFRVVSDDQFVVHGGRGAAAAGGAVRTLSADSVSDRDRLDRLLSGREPVSNVLGTAGLRSLFYLNELPRNLARVHYIAPLDVAAVWELEGDTLRLMDVVGPRVPPLAELLPYAPPHQRLEIGFTPDKLGAPAEVRPRAFDDVLMIRGPWPIERVAFGVPPTMYF